MAKTKTKTKKKQKTRKVPARSPAIKAGGKQAVAAPPKAVKAETAATQPSPPARQWRQRIPGLYAWTSVLILLATTVYWALLGAIINQGNADQLVNSYLFENSHTFEQAIFPNQHSFLLKWPLFWLIKVFHFTPGAFVAGTVMTVVLTVSLFAWLLYRFERRPLYFGTICLALASVLLLIPAQPYAGGLLPVNMAMTTTRNIEYILFVASLVVASRLQTWRSWRFWSVTGMLTLLIASDKLFMSLAAGGAIIGGLVYIAAKRYQLLRVTAYTLLACAAATVAASIVLAFLNAANVTHISASSGAGPYAIALSLHNLVLGSIYAVAGIATNLGANPAFDATVLSNAPHLFGSRLVSAAGLGYLANIGILLGSVWAAFVIIRRQLWPRQLANTGTAEPPVEAVAGRRITVTLSLLWAAVAATGAFVVTNHAYPVDARYISLWLFALFACLALYSRTRAWPIKWFYIAGSCLLVAIGSGVWGAAHRYHAEKAALASVQSRNTSVAHALANHHTDILVGDYWRVIPTKAVAQRSITALPLASCTNPRDVLLSKAWQPDLHNHSFAYLLTIEKGLTDFPACSLQQVIDTYGRPSSSVVIAGQVAAPQEVLLFYDHGINPVAREPNAPPQATASVIPLTLDELPRNQVSCNGRPTTLTVVAHEDDDLLFMNPNLSHDIDANHCVRTIYLTAGDSGGDEFYWLGRERGSQAAYDVMDGAVPDTWLQKIVTISNIEDEMTGKHRYLTIASPRNNPAISLIFMHLPDGGLAGQGFGRSHFESLAQLENGSLAAIHSIDQQSTYTADSLTNTLTTLIRLYEPTEIHTQADYASLSFPDHSDHMATGHFTHRAQQQYAAATGFDIPIHYYLGYPVREHEENLSGHDLSQKESAFFAYAQYDKGVCQSEAACLDVPTYYDYLRRQYEYTPGE